MKTLRTPLAHARGIGSAKEGPGHWWIQRLTSVALIPLALYFLYLLVTLAGADYAAVRATVAQPWNGLLLVLFVVAMFWHLQLGLQVVVEDYVHSRWQEVTLQILIRFLCFVLGLAAILAIGRIVFSA